MGERRAVIGEEGRLSDHGRENCSTASEGNLQVWAAAGDLDGPQRGMVQRADGLTQCYSPDVEACQRASV